MKSLFAISRNNSISFMLIPPNLRKLIILIAYVLSDKKMNIDADLGSNITLVSSEMARKVEEMRSETKRAKNDQEKIQNLATKLIEINSSYRVKKNENEKLREEAGRLSNRIKELEYIKAFPFPVALVDEGSEVSKKIRREMERLPNPTSTAEVREKKSQPWIFKGRVNYSLCDKNHVVGPVV